MTLECMLRCTTTCSPRWRSARQATRLPFEPPFVSTQVRWAPHASAASCAERLKRRRPDPLVDAVDQRRDIQGEHALAEHIGQLALSDRVTTVPRHVEPDVRPARVGAHRVRIRGRRLGRRRRRRSRRRSAHDTPIVRTPQQATDAPVTTMIISRAGQQRRCRRTRRRRVQPRRASASAKRSAARPSSSRSSRRLRR